MRRLLPALAAFVPWGFSEPRIGVVEIEGTISSSERVVRWVKRLQDDPSVKAVVLKINSPGGGIVASQEIYLALRRLAEKKPLVAYMGSVAASGGLYVSLAADSIVAAPGTATGSIGVIMWMPVVKGLMEKLGLEVEVYKSAAHKDITSPFRRRTPQEDSLLQALIEDMYRQFVETVAERRGLPVDSVLKLADGRLFTGRQALEAGLVDKLGDFIEAVEVAKRMAGLKRAKLLKPRKKSLLEELLYPDDATELLGKFLVPKFEFR